MSLPGSLFSSSPGRGGSVEQLVAEVLPQPDAVGGHGQAAPAGRGSVQYRPYQGHTAGLAGEPADELGPAAGLAEGPLDLVRVPGPRPVVARKPQVGGQRGAVVFQAPHRGGEPLVISVYELVDPLLYVVDSLLPRCDLVGYVEQLPVCDLDLLLGVLRHLRQHVPSSMDHAALP